MTNLKVPETFRPEKKLEEKIEKLVKKVEELEGNFVSETCCVYKNRGIILKFEKEEPIGIICKKYEPENEYTCGGSKHQCVYTLGFKHLKYEKK